MLKGCLKGAESGPQVWESSRCRASCSAAVLFEWQPGDADESFARAEQLAKKVGEKGRVM